MSVYETKTRKYDAVGFYNSSGFTVLKDSIIADASVQFFSWKEKRKAMLKEYTATEDEKLVMTYDKVFSSLSTAACFCLGRSSNGWIEWKDKDGNILDSVYRKELDE